MDWLKEMDAIQNARYSMAGNVIGISLDYLFVQESVAMGSLTLSTNNAMMVPFLSLMGVFNADLSKDGNADKTLLSLNLFVKEILCVEMELRNLENNVMTATWIIEILVTTNAKKDNLNNVEMANWSQIINSLVMMETVSSMMVVLIVGSWRNGNVHRYKIKGPYAIWSVQMVAFKEIKDNNVIQEYKGPMTDAPNAKLKCKGHTQDWFISIICLWIQIYWIKNIMLYFLNIFHIQLWIFVLEIIINRQ